MFEAIEIWAERKEKGLNDFDEIYRNALAAARSEAANGTGFIRSHVVGVGPGRGVGISANPFPRPALRTRRANLSATGSPRIHATVAVMSVSLAVHGVLIFVPR